MILELAGSPFNFILASFDLLQLHFNIWDHQALDSWEAIAELQTSPRGPSMGPVPGRFLSGSGPR